MNLNNLTILKGRTTADPTVFTNKDGSSKVKFTMAVEDNFKTKGEKQAQMIPVEAYVKNDFEKSPFSKIHKGDKISIEASIRDNNYKDEKGVDHYGIVVFIENVQFEESKSTTEARAAANAAAKATAAADIAQAPVPVNA